MIAVVNYGLGNVQAILNIYHRLGIRAVSATRESEVLSADKIILPGVGAFDWAVARLRESGLLETLTRRVISDGVPTLGICVGMQMLGAMSEEGALPGLNWIPGKVRKLSNFGECPPLPHMGWNSVRFVGNTELFVGLHGESQFYFLHSFYFEPDESAAVLALSQYGREFASAVRRGRIFGVQFHPEKSHGAGVQLLRNFAEISQC